jgi:transposase
MARKAAPLILEETQRRELMRMVCADSTPQALVKRARLILRRAELQGDELAAKAENTTRQTMLLWRNRFTKHGIQGLLDAPRPGRPTRLPAQKLNTVLGVASQKPPAGRARWSIRAMGRHAGVSKSRVQVLWSRNDIKPHRKRSFKLSNDKDFGQKFWDVIGLYLQPPQKALVLCCDEKSQCQALERTQPGLPLGMGHIRTQTHDHIRHGTLTLFAALNHLGGKIHSAIAPRHTHAEWLAFLKQLERECPKQLDLHLIVDNYATHKHAKVKAWLAKHPRFHMHFTPSGSSWMNLVERFFRDLTVDVVREGSFTGVRELAAAMERHLAGRNENPKPYRWKAQGEQILRRIQSARAVLNSQVINGSAH